MPSWVNPGWAKAFGDSGAVGRGRGGSGEGLGEVPALRGELGAEQSHKRGVGPKERNVATRVSLEDTWCPVSRSHPLLWTYMNVSYHHLTSARCSDFCCFVVSVA